MQPARTAAVAPTGPMQLCRSTVDTPVGPMLAPNYPNWFLNISVPAGQTLQFKFIKIAANGTVTWESGSNHSYTVPTSGTAFVTVNWQN